MPMNDPDLQRVILGLLGIVMIMACAILRFLVTRKDDVDHHLNEISSRVQIMNAQFRDLQAELARTAFKLKELQEQVASYPRLIEDVDDEFLDPAPDEPALLGAEPAPFEVYRQDLWKMAEGCLSIDEFVSIWRGRKRMPRPKHDRNHVDNR